MKTFEDIYAIVEESSHETAFNREECKAIYDLLGGLGTHDFPLHIVEIGVEFGRSTTVFAEFQVLHPDCSFIAIDKWVGEYSEKAKAHVLEQAAKYNWRLSLLSKDSVEASIGYPGNIGVLHIDGDHEYESVLADCNAWLPKVKVGGYALFDDYGHDSLPGVFKAVSEYMTGKEKEWQFVGRYGNKLGIYRRIA